MKFKIFLGGDWEKIYKFSFPSLFFFSCVYEGQTGGDLLKEMKGGGVMCVSKGKSG